MEPNTIYVCPMHRNVRESAPDKCPTCGMALVPEGTRLPLLRHMLNSPRHLLVMLAVMAALMAAAMMLIR
jgi:hypothetical protein